MREEGFYLGDTGYCPWTLRLSRLEVSVPNINWGKNQTGFWGKPLYLQNVVHGPAVKSSMISERNWTLGSYLRTHVGESECKVERLADIERIYEFTQLEKATPG